MGKDNNSTEIDRRKEFDLLILSVIPPELTAALKALGINKHSRFKDEDGTIYYSGNIKSYLTKQKYSVLLGCIGQAGNPSAAAATATAIEKYRPKAVLLIGIAGGIREKTRIGEVLVSDRIVDYEPAAFTTIVKQGKAHARAKEENRPNIERILHSINQDLQNWIADENMMNRLQSRFEKVGGTFPEAPRGKKLLYKQNVANSVLARPATLATGEKLFRNNEKFYALRKLHGKVEAVEMEAGGLIEACRRRSIPWLVVRGVSDFGDAFKDSCFHDFASITAAVALSDFIAYGLEIGNSSGGSSTPNIRGDVKRYLERIDSDLKSNSYIRRTLSTSAGNKIHISSKKEESTFEISEGTSVFIHGSSGRGKTTLLKMLAVSALHESCIRVPVFLRPTPDATVVSLLQSALGLDLSISSVSIKEWSKQTPILFIIDDWHKLSEAERHQTEKLASDLCSHQSSLVIAGTDSVYAPRITNLHHMILNMYSPAERDEFIAKQLQFGFGDSSWLLKQTPTGFTEIMCEPILLSKYLEMINRSIYGGIIKPYNLPDLFHKLLESLLSSRHDKIGRRADEVSCVCSKLAFISAGISLEQIDRAITNCGARGSASEFAEDMCESRIWSRVAGSFYTFEHEIWRVYFCAIAIAADSHWASMDSIRAWIGTLPKERLETMIPFITGFIKTVQEQDALLDALLSIDAKLYLRALVNRASVREESIPSFETLLLQRIRAGYLDLIEKCVPKMKIHLEPWNGGDGLEIARGERVVICGIAKENDIAWYFGFAPPEVGEVVIEHPCWDERPKYAPLRRYSQHSHRVGNDHIRIDSGRLLGARILLKQLLELGKKTLPPIGWVARERFRSLVSKLGFHGAIGKDWRKLRVTQINKIFINLRNEIHKEVGNKNPIKLNNLTGDDIVLDELIMLGDYLSKSGFSRTSLWNLGLPNPDLNKAGWFSNSYSRKQKIARISALYKAVQETYKEICETYFSGMKQYFWYAQLPARAVINITDSPSGDTGWQLRWELTENWDAEPVVTYETKIHFKEMDRLADQFRNDCIRYNRRFIRYTISNTGGDWAPWDLAVTNAVSNLLNSDLRTVEDWIAGAI